MAKSGALGGAGVRYETGVPIGSGGMGTVIKAFDPVLKRHVALKILRRDEPELAERMLREARAQAAVDHPNVAKVYEVGYLEDGRPFIAMQLIEGKPLDEAVRDLTLDQKIQLVATVAEAVQAAHATGLVHRDLKPSNILVEQGAEQGLKPYVLDFGIAREEAVPGLTVTGQVLGTPGYMAPEQAAGAVHSLDRRADLFSLGVILYELVCGHHPFRGDSAVEKLVSLLNDEPESLRKRFPATPPDLEAVIFKCLEKRPEHRYPSARALADELHRYLAGEPVQARRITRIGLLVRRARRHPAVTALVGVALVVVLSALVLALGTYLGSQKRARLAQELGQRVERIDSAMRVAHLLPGHDLSREKASVRREMDGIRDAMARFGGVAHAAGHYALGRGYLTLREPEAARGELEEAWAQGYRPAAAAMAAAHAYAELYRQRLDEARRHRDAEARTAGLARADRELRQPALRFLGGAHGDEEGDLLLVRGLLALAEREPTEALGWAAKLARIEEGSPESVARAAALTGEAYLQQAKELRWGRNRETHGKAVASAREAFSRAVDTLRSDPVVHLGLCRAWNATVEMEADAGARPAESLQRTQEMCGLAARVDPSQPAPHVELGSAFATLAQFGIRRGTDPSQELERAEQAAASALAVAPDSFDGTTLRGTALMLRAEWLREKPSESARLLAEAIDLFSRAQDLDPHRPEGFHLQGNALLDLMESQKTLGEDPIPTINAALEAFEKSQALPEGATRRTYNSLGAAYGDLGLMQRLRGQDSRASLRRGIEALDKAVAMSPDYVPAHTNRGLATWELAEYAAATDGDPLPDYARALESFARVLAIDPTRLTAHTNSAGVLVCKARWQVRRGEDPDVTLVAVEAHLGVVRRSFAWDFGVDSSEVALVRAAWALQQRSGGVEKHLEVASRHAESLLRLAPEEPSGELLLAEVERLRVEAMEAAGRGDRNRLESACRSGLDHASKALAINPRLARALAARGILLHPQARLASEPAARRVLAGQAREAAQAALAVEPLLMDDAVRKLVTSQSRS